MYGQRITSVDTHSNTLNTYANTQDTYPTRYKIPVTLVLEPITHFDSNYTNFKTLINTDDYPSINGTVFANTYGNSSVADTTDIQHNSINGELFKRDRLVDVYLESLTTFNCKFNNSKNNMAFKININDWTINNHSNLLKNNEFLIANTGKSSTKPKTEVNKSRTLNYICSMVPDTLVNINGKITMLDDTTIFRNPEDSNSDRVILEFLFVSR